MPTVVNSKGETTEASDVDATNMVAADPSLKIVGDVAVAADRPGDTVTSMSAQRVGDMAGAQAASASDIGATDRKNYLKDKTSTIGATVRGGLGGLTMGASDSWFDPDTIEADEAHHSIAHTLGTVGGAFLPGLVGDESGFANLFRDPEAAEQAASGLSSKFLLSGEAGSEAGSTGKLVEKGLARAGEHLDLATAASTAPELAGLDAKGLRIARESELDSLAGRHAAERVAAKASSVDDIVQYQSAFKEANPYLVTGEGPASASFAKSSRAIRNALDDAEGLREAPGKLLAPLRKQAQALEETIGEREAIAAKFEATNTKIARDLDMDIQTLPDAATHVQLEGKAARRYAAFSDVKVGKDATISVAREDATQFLEALNAGEVRGEGQKAMDGLQGLLDQNKALQGKIKGATAPMLGRSELASDRLTAINSAHDVLMTPAKPKSMIENMLGGSIMGHVAGAFSGMPIVGPMIGAKVGALATDVVFGRMGKAAAESAVRSTKAVKSFIGSAVLSPALPVLATRTLARVQYAPQAAPLPDKPALADLFKARTDELKSQTMYGPDGKPVMRPEARAAMAAKLSAIRSVDSIGADKIETLAARRLEFLSSKIPRRPDLGGLPTGPDNWKPSDLEMRSFARFAAAIEDPGAVEERVAHGTVTPEDAEAYFAVYPERARAFQQAVIAQLPTMRTQLPFAKRMSFSIFTRLPVDPSMMPNILQVLQEGFAAEPNSNGGTQAPTASPQFGSIKKSVELPTPSQSRA